MAKGLAATYLARRESLLNVVCLLSVIPTTTPTQTVLRVIGAFVIVYKCFRINGLRCRFAPC